MSVQQFQIEVAKAVGFADLVTNVPRSPNVRRVQHGQHYGVTVGYGKASDGSTGWIVSVYLRSGFRNFTIAETIGSLPRSSESPTSMSLRVLPYRRSHRHARILGLLK